MKWGRKTKQLGYKKLGYTALQGITHRGAGRRLPSALLSWEEQNEPHSCEAHSPSFCTCKVQLFTFELTKVFGGSGQWCSLDIGNCQTVVIGNLASSLTSVIIVFCNIFYVFGIIRSWSLSLTEPHALCLVGKVILGTDLRSSCSIHYYAYERQWHTTTSGPWTPSASTQYPSHSVAGTDVAGLAQSTEGVGRCDTTERGAFNCRVKLPFLDCCLVNCLL